MYKPCLVLALSFCLLAAVGCNAPASKDRALTANVPLHLEEHIDAARIEGSELPKDMPEPLEWRFDKTQPGWKPIAPYAPGLKPIQVSQQGGALRLAMTKDNRSPWGYRMGCAYTDIGGLKRSDWGLIVIQARTTDEITSMSPCFNLRKIPANAQGTQSTFSGWAEGVTVIHDGEIHTYIMRAETAMPDEKTDSLTQFGIVIIAGGLPEKDDSKKGPMTFEILSISVIPKEAEYAKLRAGISREFWGVTHRRTLYTHVPGKLEYEVTVPAGGRLDIGLGLLKKGQPVQFRVTVREQGARAGERVLLEEACSADKPRPQRSVDLSKLAGRTVVLGLETEAAAPGNVAFWSAPTISGAGHAAAPNIVLYVIDGGAAEFMSVYGYNRRTTPYLERLAAEGALFEHAYSNSSKTKSSVPSFMTSLHHSVLGGYESGSDPLPEQAVPMSERLHRAGYLTEVLTSNPYVGRMSSLDRGVDSMADTGVSEDDPDELPASEELQRDFWNYREAYPAQPYWVHFQPTDVHAPREIVAPFSGLFATLEERKTLEEMEKKMRGVVAGTSIERFKKAGVDPARHTEISRKLYDEAMAHIDHSIGQLVERIKARGEWENTLFIVAADHSHQSADLTVYDPKMPQWHEPNIASQISWIPMIFVWPGKIRPGLRLTQPVSMIDLLPTVLDLAGLPAAEIAQGQSLAPLLLGRPGWTPRPVVFDELNIEGEYFTAAVDVIDGRWGASLLIDTHPDDKKGPIDRLRPAPVLIFDVWDDPHAFKDLHASRPDLVEKYTKMLEGIWKEHQALAKKFTRSAKIPLTKEQIETLRSLGYVK